MNNLNLITPRVLADYIESDEDINANMFYQVIELQHTSKDYFNKLNAVLEVEANQLNISTDELIDKMIDIHKKKEFDF